MDPSIHRGDRPVADGYRHFARREAHGISAVYEAWANAVADDDAVLALIDTLPRPKRQPNLVFAAARHHGADSTYDSFRSTMLKQWEPVRRTIMSRATQTNEAARCAVLLPFLAGLPQPLALIEVGAAAGLCLLPDLYSYRYDDGTHLDPADGPSEVVITSQLGPGITAPSAMPQIAWRAGIDLAPIDVMDHEACAWLETLIWPGQPDRLERLKGALAIARRDPPRIVQGNLIEALPDLAHEAPADATLVVFHSAVLAYLSPEDRSHFLGLVNDLPGHWISNEGQSVLPVFPSPSIRADDGRFVLSVDGRPRALTDPHGRSMTGLAQ
jgi:hypothetical protein